MAREAAAGGDGQPTRDMLRKLADDFDDLNTLIGDGEPGPVLATVVSVAANRIDAARTVSVSRFVGGQFTTVAASDDYARRADDLQQLTGEGPCLDTIFGDAIYNPHDLAHDRRWPRFGSRLSAELGLRSMLSYRLSPPGGDVEPRDPGAASAPPRPGGTESPTRQHLVASLNIYGAAPHAFDEAAVVTGLLLATHARTAIEATLAVQRAHNLDQALRSSREIGTAIGVLMARHGLTREQAFNLLRVTSQRLNRKISDIAVDVADTGALPDS